MEDLYDPEEKILCPYESSHHIRRYKMTVHLVKCRKSHPDVSYVPCDFNASHMVAEPELKYHHQICPDRKKIEAQIVESVIKSESKFPIPKLNLQADECWDDIDVPTYDPTKYATSTEVLRHLDVESSAKRKNFRLNERQRVGALSSQEVKKPEIPRQEEAVSLPPHRSVTTVSDDRFKPNALQEKLRLDTAKLYSKQKRNNNL